MSVRAGMATTAVAILAAAAAGRAHALDPDLAVTQYVQTVWRAPASLPHDDVTSVVQTRDGYLWVGTVEGLARFDGVRSVVFEKANTPALANNWVRALLEDRAGRLWIGTFGGGLVCREGGRFVRVGASRGMPSDVVNALFEDAAGRVWAGTLGAGFFRLDDGRFVREKGTEASFASTVRAFAQDASGTLWIGTQSGLFKLDRGVLTRLTRADGLTDDAVLSLAADAEGLWIGTESGGVNRLLNGRITAIGTREGLTHDRVWSLALDHDGNLWIGTDGGGLNRLSRGRLTAFTTRNGLTSDYVWAIREDREGGLWVATNGGGLNRLKNGRVVCLTTREGLPSDFLWAVLRGRDGSLYLGTEDAGLARVKDGRVATFGAREGLLGSARVLLERRDGALWIGGSRGLHELREGRVRAVSLPGLPSEDVHVLAEEASGALWIGSSKGLRKFQDGPLRAFSRSDGLSGDAVAALLLARDGSTWVGTLGGVDQIKGDRVVQSFPKSAGLPSEYVTSLFEGPDGAVWAGTRGGLVRIWNGRLEQLTARHGLFDDAIMSAALGDDGGVWLGSNRGLARVPLKELEDVLAHRRERAVSTSFGLDDGMRNVEVNSAGSAICKDPDGRLWFATRGGAASVLPARFVSNPVPPPVFVEEVLRDGRALPGRGPWRLPPGSWRLDFRFTALSLLAPGSVRIRHRLEGWDPDWVDSDADRVAHYANLPNGRYRFHVIAANDAGVWNEKGASVELEIEPRFHERTWFRVLVVLFFTLAGPLFYLVRVRRLRAQKAELERLVAERTAEVQAANERLAHLAREDALTGVANRRPLDEALEAEWRRAHRTRTPLSLLLLDVDLFKAYNDRLGHPAGDACLKAVAEAVTAICQRAGELVARYGGDEFVVLMPAVSEESAHEVAEKVRKGVQALGLPHPGSTVAPVVTVSVGVASAEPAAGGSPEDLVGAADRALYRAKQGGRNRVSGRE